jgi:microsomal dipeptidase-like Zn-dependent dipeptidase
MPTSIRGFADLHTHPMAHLGFGGKVVAGAPWHEGGLSQALANCQGVGGAHNPTGNKMALLAAFIRGISEAHGPCGMPTFLDWPQHQTIYHQQMYIDWLRRSHANGLRLVCALVVNNELLARECGAVRYSDFNMLESQITGLRQFVEYARKVCLDAGVAPWVEIADSPAAARAIIADGQLAIVIGVEIDTLESLARHVPGGNDEPSHLPAGPSLPTRGLRSSPFVSSEIAAVLDVLARFGVSMITPVHLADNSLGGAAIYDDRFDILNCWLRGNYYPAQMDSSVEFQLGRNKVLFELMRLMVGLPPRSYAGLGWVNGHANQNGLSPVGAQFIVEAMKRGLIIDVDHMSAKTTDAVLSLASTHQYPVVSSHSSFRELGLKRSETPNPLGFSHEGMKTAAQVEGILALGGVVAPLTNQHQCRSHGSAVANDCDGSSKSFAQAFLYAVDKVAALGKGGVALGSDFNGLGQQPGARYAAGAPAQDPSQRVRYDDLSAPAYFTGQPLSRNLLPGRSRPFDLNVDGLAHHGLLADFIEDLRQIKVPTAAIDTLFNSAEAFVGMWETCRSRAQVLSAAPP